MENLFLKRENRLQTFYALLLAVALIMAGCNSEFDRVLPDPDGSDSLDVSFGTPKVLYLIVDGARGQSVESIRPPVLTSLLPNSIYSWSSVSDDQIAGNGTNWADMLTGVSKDKHQIVNDNYEDKQLEQFPTILGRIKETQRDAVTAMYGTSENFIEHFAAGTDFSEVLMNDELLTDALIEQLQQEDLTVLVGQFSEVDRIGSADGYDQSVPSYQEAILNFDQQVGELLEAVRQRPNYERENWMLVVTSSRGGDFPIPDDQNDNTIFSNPQVNTFTIFYTPRYLTRFIGKPFLGNRYQGDFIRFNDQRHAYVTAGDNEVYNLGGVLQGFTIELKVKKNVGPNNNYRFNYPSLLGKRPEWTSGWPSNGWVVFLEEDFWMFNARGTGGAEQVRGDRLADATWNSIAVVGVVRDNRRYVRTFTNGRFNNERDITGWGNLDNNSLLKLGYIQGNGHREPDAYISDVRIWKTAMPDSVINQYACSTTIDEGHPYYDFLAGYWPVVGSVDDQIEDIGPLGSHMTLSNHDFERQTINEYLCAPTAADLASLVPRNVDIPSQIISWLKVPRRQDWQLDGRVWLDR